MSVKMIDEALHLRGDVPRARIDDVHGRGWCAPVTKHALEPAGAQILHAAKRGKESDAEADCRCGVENVEVAHEQARGQADLR